MGDLIQTVRGSINEFFIIYFEFNSSVEIIRNVVDILIVAYFLYKFIGLIHDTRAWQLLKGILFIFIAAKISEWVGFSTTSSLLNIAIQYMAFALLIIFQPELRGALERIGRSKLNTIIKNEKTDMVVKANSFIEEVVKAANELSQTLTGALIVIEKNVKIEDIINTGTKIEASTSSQLLVNIFTPNTPLHDGAVIIRDFDIKAAACFLPLTDNRNLNKSFGTRHRAGIGVTEISDAIVVIVSEETGNISYASDGVMNFNVSLDSLRRFLNKNLVPSEKPSKRHLLKKGRRIK